MNIITICSLFFVVSVVAQTPSLSVVPSRTSGTAPLAVFFDATGTRLSNKDAFREVTYTFNFGDPNSGTWRTTGLSKNNQTGGPLAAHVYDNPGTYKVSVRASAPGGYYQDATLNIVVLNPNVTFAGNKTVCVSATSNWSDCPAGALKRTTVPTGTDWNGKRWLFRRGETFDQVNIQDGNANVLVSGYGSGANPQFSAVHVGDWRPNTANFANEIVVMGLTVKGPGMTQCLGKRVLFYNNNITTTTDGAIGIGFGEPGYWIFDDPYRFVPQSQFYNPTELFFVDNYIRGDVSSSQGNIYGSSSRTAFMGNDAERSKFHNLRCTKCYKVFFGNNRFGGVSTDGGYHSLKLHSRGLNDSWVYNDNATISGPDWISQYNVIANNILSSAQDNNVWIMMVSPQNSNYPERIGDVIVENNKVYKHSADQVDILLTGRNITYRNNKRTDGSNVVILFNEHGDALPASWKGPYFNVSTPVVTTLALQGPDVPPVSGEALVPSGEASVPSDSSSEVSPVANAPVVSPSDGSAEVSSAHVISALGCVIVSLFVIIF